MSGNKYKVEQNGQFLGHYCAHNPKEAVLKSINNYGKYYNIDKNGTFHVTRGSKTWQVTGEE